MATKHGTLKMLSVLNALTRQGRSCFPQLRKEIQCLRQLSHGSPYGPHLGGASLLSLPGNRLLASVCSASDPSFMPQRQRGTRRADVRTSMNLGVCGIEQMEDFTPLCDENVQQGVTEEINRSLEQGEAGRLYAVVYVRGVQHKVTVGDVIIVKYDFPPTIGDQLRLEKVLAVGGRDFSLIGQPLLSRNHVRVDATVVEKTLSHNRVWFVYRKRRSFKKFHLYRETFTMLAINSIQVARIPGDEKDGQVDNANRIN